MSHDPHRAASQTRWRKPMVLASPTGAHAKTSTRRDPGAVTSVSLSGCTGYTAYLRYGVLRCRLNSFRFRTSRCCPSTLYIVYSYTSLYTIQPLQHPWSPRGSSALNAFCHYVTRRSQGGLSKNTLHKYSVPRCGVRILLRAHQSHRLDSRSSLPA